MGKLLVDRLQLERIRFLDRISSGKEGICYTYGDRREVVKLYHFYMLKRKVYFDDLKSSNITFPKDILIDSLCGQIAGYTMDFVDGVKIHEGFPQDLSLEILKKMYIDIKKEIEKYSDIYMDDMCVANILADYQNMQFRLIDTSRWYPKDNSFSDNMKSFDSALSYVLSRRTLTWFSKYLSENQDLFKAYSYNTSGKCIPFLEFLEMIEDEIFQKFGEKAETIEDLTPKVLKKNLIF